MVRAVVNSPTDVSENTLMWLVGLFEGEGYFQPPQPSVPNRQPKIIFKTTKQELAEEVAHIFGVKPYRVPDYADYRPITYKPQWRVTVSGNSAIMWLKALYPHMRAQRQEQIYRILSPLGVELEV